MATLFGIEMLSYQVGCKVFEITGACNWVWYVAIVLAVGAALINLPIRDAKLTRVARTAA